MGERRGFDPGALAFAPEMPRNSLSFAGVVVVLWW